MSELMSLHEAHVARLARMGGKPPAPKPMPVRRLSPFDPRRAPQVAPERLEPPASIIPQRKWKTITKEVADKHGVSVENMLSPSRWKELVAARGEAYYRIRRETTMSLPQIGRCFKRDHTSILNGINQHTKSLEAAR